MEAAPVERLQPCLLDRLTDDEPAVQAESRVQRVISPQRYTRGVIRDLEWLFTCSAHLPQDGADPLPLERYPLAQQSVVNFGVRHLFGLTAPNMRELERSLTRAIQLFEPRINPATLKITARQQRQVIVFELRADVWANPLPEQLYIKTQLDLETGGVSLLS